ncbi:hypothetical protein F5887DRAFT_26021 [Amanita rubescens]|nr:hypothetical protein F5887DRAFT_26021 [Amanita rubescens]
MPPLRGSVIGGNTKLYVEAASTAATRDTGAVASEFPVQGDKEIVAIQSNDKYDKHDQDIYEVLGPLRPNGVGTHAISATLDNGSGKADTEHALLKMTLSQREQSTFELIKPRKTDASHAKTLIDLTSDDVEDVDYGAEVLFQEDLMEAQAIKSTEQVDLSKKVKNVVPAMEASNSMTRVSLLRRAGEGEKVEDVTPTHATDPQGRKTATSRASVSFVVPTLMNGGTHTATEDEHTRFFVLRSRQKRHRTETNIQTQTSQRQSAESYFDRPKSQADADIIPRIAEVRYLCFLPFAPLLMNPL